MISSFPKKKKLLSIGTSGWIDASDQALRVYYVLAPVLTTDKQDDLEEGSEEHEPLRS
jgi:hypothetical protein